MIGSSKNSGLGAELSAAANRAGSQKDIDAQYQSMCQILRVGNCLFFQAAQMGARENNAKFRGPFTYMKEISYG